MREGGFDLVFFGDKGSNKMGRCLRGKNLLGQHMEKRSKMHPNPPLWLICWHVWVSQGIVNSGFLIENGSSKEINSKC